MNRLPVEISQRIFLLLNQQEKVKCMAVCKQWESLIKSFCLFHTVCLSSHESIKKLIEALNEEPKQGAQMENLIISRCYERSQVCDLNELLILLPNLRVFHVRSASLAFRTVQYAPQSWRRRLEHIVVWDSYLVERIISCYQFDNLKTLSFIGAGMLSKNILNLLQRTPNLTDLRIKVLRFSLDLLEGIHKAIPRLTALALLYVIFDGTELPRDIQPIHSCKSLNIDCFNTRHQREHLVLMRYISLKYTNLTTFLCRATGHFSEIDGEGLQSNFLEALQPLLRNTGSSLTTLAMNFSFFGSTAFKMMDDNDCHPSTLSFQSDTSKELLYSFCRSNLVNSVRRLELNGLPNSDLDCLSVLSGLQELSLFFGLIGIAKNTADIKTVLKCCPDKIDTLQIGFLVLTCTYRPYEIYPMRRLKFHCCEFKEDVDVFLARSVPQLRYLSLINCLYTDKKISLPNVHLLYFKVQFHFHVGTPNMVVSTSKDRKKRLYIGIEHDLNSNILGSYHQPNSYSINNVIVPVILNGRLKPKVELTVECASIKNVSLSLLKP